MPLLDSAGADADAVYYGPTPVDAVYLGNDKVWPSATTGPTPGLLPITDAPYEAYSVRNPSTGQIGLRYAPDLQLNHTDLNGVTRDLAAIPVGSHITITHESGSVVLSGTITGVVNPTTHGGHHADITDLQGLNVGSIAESPRLLVTITAP
jgi:hypothetical protein